MTLADTLATWLPAQRWYPGTGAAVRDLVITAASVVSEVIARSRTVAPLPEYQR